MPNIKIKFLAGLLVLSIILNFYLFTSQPAHEELLILKDKINLLEKSNAGLTKQVYNDNLSIQNYASQLDLYRHRISELDSKLNNTASGFQGTAELQAPAVMQKVDYISDYPFVRQQIVEVGSMMNISAEVKPGKGRVLVQTKPLMGVVFQDAANTAVYVAQNKTKNDLSGTIDRFGHVGEIGGVIEKASAARDSGKTLILIPRENSRLIQKRQETFTA